jgi:hypothetical protein
MDHDRNASRPLPHLVTFEEMNTDTTAAAKNANADDSRALPESSAFQRIRSAPTAGSLPDLAGMPKSGSFFAIFTAGRALRTIFYGQVFCSACFCFTCS